MFKNKDFIVYFNIAFLILAFTSDLLYMYLGHPYIFKTFASCVFVVGGAVNLIFCAVNKKDHSRKPLYKYFMMTGLVFAMLGDILLIDNFTLGAILFAIGHIWFTVAFCYIDGVRSIDGVCSLAIFVVSAGLILFVPTFEFGDMLLLVSVYAFVISIMLGNAMGNFITKRTLPIAIVLVGAVLFYLSDAMLLFNVFGNAGKWADILCLMFYYPAEYVLAVSIYFVSANKVEDKGELNVVLPEGTNSKK